jgi:hypothetical protein
MACHLDAPASMRDQAADPTWADPDLDLTTRKDVNAGKL